MQIISNALNPEGEQVKIILLDSYIAAIKNSVGSKLFRNLYANINNKKEDIARNGKLSCDIYVSSVLLLFGLIDAIHATVDGCARNLEKFGWYKIKKPKTGAILIWEAKRFQSGMHKHIGFYIGNDMAISHRSEKRSSIVHHWTYNGKRKIESIFWNKRLTAR